MFCLTDTTIPKTQLFSLQKCICKVSYLQKGVRKDSYLSGVYDTYLKVQLVLVNKFIWPANPSKTVLKLKFTQHCYTPAKNKT